MKLLAAMTDGRAAYCILAVESQIPRSKPWDIKHSKNKEQLKEVTGKDARFKKVERQAVDVINVTTGSRVKYPKGDG